MSGLKLVPRIPKWPSTANGSEAASSATSATGQPARSASAPPSRRPHRYATEAITKSSTTIAEIVPSPGRRTVPQQTAPSSARPTAGESQDQRRCPQSPTAAWPSASEEPQIANTAT